MVGESDTSRGVDGWRECYEYRCRWESDTSRGRIDLKFRWRNSLS